ncbi:hypothetical protein [Xanthomonas prunicola]|uniref:Uncharacterized protein n=1 Tax=Xanthomonas prunicola TaxID=2053930 RepID=A0A2N3RPB8_9XANT|nr:hypothetical protein [Xanthomonas prunicola]PKV14324.1 hypothetical protein XpruCFBP8353_04515 [Xanthomonas prunicola]PKV18606.1 hypothetical protein XpruCFBP8354_04515 [Xanthomonas prunicola]PKV22085.1 hypothetical protein CVO74_01940 [Xanthomonas prunicola]
MRPPPTLLSSLVALLLLLPLSATAQSGWINQQGEAIADSPSRKMVQGFGASLLLTSDADWAAKWNTPSDTTPHFNEVDHVSTGDALFLLIFISHPGLDAQQRADVVCSIRVIDPTGHAEQNAVDAPCLQGPIGGDPGNVFLAHVGMTVHAEASEPPGRWQVQVTLIDRQRGLSIPLSTTYTQGRQRTRAKPR